MVRSRSTRSRIHRRPQRVQVVERRGQEAIRERQGKQRIVRHGGCGPGLIREATRPKHRFAYVNRPLHATVASNFYAWCIIRAKEVHVTTRRKSSALVDTPEGAAVNETGGSHEVEWKLAA
jgi:hypothetical protein